MKYVDAVINGYFDAAEWIQRNPHATLWLAVSAILLALVA